MKDEIVRGTAWLSMAALALYAALKVRSARARDARTRAGRWVWTVGCALLWIHVACAFHFRHHWSHAAAYSETARQTAESAGFNWGGGLYFNYLMLIVWTADAVWEGRHPESYQRRHSSFGWLIGGFMAFMALNATVVFVSGALRWLALGIALLLALAAVVRWQRENRKA